MGGGCVLSIPHTVQRPMHISKLPITFLALMSTIFICKQALRIIRLSMAGKVLLGNIPGLPLPK